MQVTGDGPSDRSSLTDPVQPAMPPRGARLAGAGWWRLIDSVKCKAVDLMLDGGLCVPLRDWARGRLLVMLRIN